MIIKTATGSENPTNRTLGAYETTDNEDFHAALAFVYRHSQDATQFAAILGTDLYIAIQAAQTELCPNPDILQLATTIKTFYAGYVEGFTRTAALTGLAFEVQKPKVTIVDEQLTLEFHFDEMTGELSALMQPEQPQKIHVIINKQVADVIRAAQKMDPGIVKVFESKVLATITYRSIIDLMLREFIQDSSNLLLNTLVSRGRLTQQEANEIRNRVFRDVMSEIYAEMEETEETE